MKTIIHNDHQLMDSDIQVYRHKVRALIINDKGEIIATRHGGIYMLPGGKAEPTEQEQVTLIREIQEELGIDLSSTKLTAFLNIKNYLKHYPDRNDQPYQNRLTDTTYYLVHTNQVINQDLVRLTASEIENDFKAGWTPIPRLEKELTSYCSSNPRKEIFDRDLLTVLAVYQEVKRSKNNESGYVDLHLHTYHSDGELSPEALIAFAKSEGISTMAITDHDSLVANHEVLHQSLISGINLISGIELSAKTDRGRMHILGYNIDIHNQALNQRLLELRDNNLNKIITLLAQLKKDYNISFSYDEIQAMVNANHNLGRPDLAKLCVQNGYAKSVEDAFYKFLNDAYDKVRCYEGGLSFEECISLIKSAGGIPVLAHPITLKRSDEEFAILLKQMIDCGLIGIEAFHTKHSAQDVEKYIKIANQNDLLISGGSDYHGPFIKPEVKIGQINNKKMVRHLSLLDYVNQR